jgi:sugar phosphate isomerase/epimerase
MRIEQNHAHAHTRYELLDWRDYLLLIKSCIEAKIMHNFSLTVHLPFEIQHSQQLDVKKALKFISYGEFLKKVFKIKLYWENAPWLNYGTWDLKYKNTLWKYIPYDIDLCLDTGHLMLESHSKSEYLKKLNKLLKERGKQIRHLHLHENNFKSDQHKKVPGKIINDKLVKTLTKNRSYIFEKGE